MTNVGFRISLFVYQRTDGVLNGFKNGKGRMDIREMIDNIVFDMLMVAFVWMVILVLYYLGRKK